MWLRNILKSIRILDKPDEFWNERLLSVPTGSVYQTVEYAEYCKQVLNRKPMFLKTEDSQMLVTVKTGTLRSLTGKNTYYWNYGPVTWNDDYSLVDYMKYKSGSIQGYLHPLSDCQTTDVWATFLIDLSDDNILQNMDKHSAQNNIRRAEEKQVFVMKNIDDYFLLFQAQRRRNGIELTRNDFDIFYNLITPLGLECFVAYWNYVPVGGIMVSSFNGWINEWGIARTDIDTKEKLYAQDLLKWKVIEWGKKNKFRYYDLTGVNPNPTTEKDKNLFRYKEKFGGNLIKYGVCIS